MPFCEERSKRTVNGLWSLKKKLCPHAPATERSSGGAAIRSKHGGYLSMDENGVVRIKELQKAGDQEMFSEVALL
ncbi:uncharacterized protein ACA1_283950 [Acanthamoeba castellanii str. Neff]|uniref:Uncharacterized protein n=1 Tax=Acanthamoeba castellanii (strain ATCC 30010 / Neff) TaxID=1257118 RepID=L8H7F7_ACACF|nr:uncharacterized protein ACA1_283950 [Acanthamoeba castellanii str. Neff]ELR21157.1 hypothetical protein ACA1_283950 [Acanthamoeba castellanii str. Neff]